MIFDCLLAIQLDLQDFEIVSHQLPYRPRARLGLYICILYTQVPVLESKALACGTFVLSGYNGFAPTTFPRDLGLLDGAKMKRVVHFSTVHIGFVDRGC